MSLLAAGLVTAGAAAAQLAPSASSNGPAPSQIVRFLEQTIRWYRDIGAQQQLVSDANDSIFVSNNRQVADEAVRLAFQFADAEAEPAGGANGASQATAAGANAGSAANSAGNQPPQQYQALTRLADQIDQQTRDTQAEADGLRQKLATATGVRQQQLQSQLAEVEAEVALSQARGEAVRNMAQFVESTSAGVGATGLRAQIDALARTVPVDLTSPSGSKASEKSDARAASASANTSPSQTGGTGLWEASANVLARWSKLRSIDAGARQTDALLASAAALRSPLLAQMRQLTGRGNELAQQADSANAATLQQETQQLDALTGEFKKLDAAADPLNKMTILLGVYQKNLVNWHSEVEASLLASVKSLSLRLGTLIVVIALLMGGAEVWRKAIFRYIRDSRRRHQLLLLRTFVLWFVIAVLVAMSFASRLGSIATFAGLLTAGVAVALQSVILSVVGYFFLIGRYGLRSGDRVEIGGVKGEVVDVGLVRIHLMELGGAGGNSPTGRVVAFSNSIVFQPTAGVFKQIPDTNFGWHEIRLTLPLKIDYGMARDRLMKAVEKGLADYKDEIDRQHRAMENRIGAAPRDGLTPSVQLRFAASELEGVVRFPVDLRHAAEIDQRVTRELLADSELTLAGNGQLRLQTESPSTAPAN